MRTNDAQDRGRVPWPARLTGGLVGLACGMGVNVLSDDVGYPGVAAAFGLAAMLAAVSWLRALPPAAPLISFAWRALLGVALAAVITAVFTSAPWSGVATLTAAVCTAAAVLIPADSQQALGILVAACSIGLGVIFIGLGVAKLRGGATLRGIAFIGLGVAVVGGEIARLRGGATLRGIAFMGFGIAFVGVGIVRLRGGDALPGIAFIGVGIAVIILGMARLNGRDIPFEIALIGLGIAVIILGIARLHGRGTQLGIALIGGGITIIVVGIAWLRGGDTQRVIAFVGAGIVFIGGGIATLRGGGTQLGIVFIGAGIASFGLGTFPLRRSGAVSRAREWLNRMTRAPDQDQATAPTTASASGTETGPTRTAQQRDEAESNGH